MDEVWVSGNGLVIICVDMEGNVREIIYILFGYVLYDFDVIEFGELFYCDSIEKIVNVV